MSGPMNGRVYDADTMEEIGKLLNASINTSHACRSCYYEHRRRHCEPCIRCRQFKDRPKWRPKAVKV